MKSNADSWACDTSVAVASLDPSHQAHTACRRVLLDLRPALAGHAAFETYSVLTRLPVPLRLRPEQARGVLAAAFPDLCWLDDGETSDLWDRIGELGVVGGATYDALVAAAAQANDRTLLTRDRRAERIYRMLDVAHVFVE